MEKRKHLHIAGGNVKWCIKYSRYTEWNINQSLKEMKYETCYNLNEFFGNIRGENSQA